MSNVVLRPISDNDTELIVKWRNNDAVKSKFIHRECTADMHRAWLKTMVQAGNVSQFIVELDGKPVGSVFLRDIDRKNMSAEFGIFIGEDNARGVGCGTEAAKQIIEYGFGKLRLHRIFLRVLSSNSAAIRSYEKAGFLYEGCAKDMVYLDGKYIDVVFMSIINKEV